MKTKEPSPVWLILVVLVFVLLILHGPWEERWGDPNGTIDCEKDDLSTLTLTQLELCIDIQSFSKGSDYE